MQKRRTWKARAVVKASLLVFLIIAVLAPLICLLFSIGSVDVGSIVGSRQFLESLKNSVLVTLTATAVSLVLALVLAWCIARSGLGKKGALSQLLSLPMLIPSISHGMGLIVLFGANGVLTNLLGPQHQHLRLLGHCHRLGDVFVPGGVFDAAGCVSIRGLYGV